MTPPPSAPTKWPKPSHASFEETVGMEGTEARAIEALLEEKRVFEPPAEFARQALINSPEVYERAKADPEGFWGSLAEELTWFRKWDQVLEWEPPFAKWFVGGQLNASYNCLDRHLGTPREQK